jgi:geranylgeranyl diphosphate synthase type II
MKQFDSTYKEFYELIQNKLFEIANNTTPQIMREPFVYLIENGGKRLRPILTMLSAGAVGGDPLVAVDCGVSVEILHNFTLVHDDIMDSSPLRRGRDTVHIKWNIPVGILVGDIMIGYACQLIPKNGKIKSQEKLQKLFMNGLIVVCEGQALDIEYNIRKDITVENYLDMINKKTANLVKTSVLMGCYCGDANEEQIVIMEEFAYSLGLAFQIQDDFLDLTSSESGKVIGQDIVEGKKTFMIIRCKELAEDKSDIELINRFYSENGLNNDDIPKVLDLIEKLGIFKEAKDLFEKHYANAEESLNKLEQNDYTKMLKEIVYLTKNRKF